MSWFFSTGKGGPQAPKINTPKLKGQAVATLARLGCRACPLNKAALHTPKMAPTVVPQSEIMFLAEAPGKHEDEESGRPLTGPSGQLVRSAIPPGLDSVCSFDNVINCRPPDNRTPVQTEIECCRPRIIEHIETIKPKLIIGLGAVPLQWMLNTTDIAGMRGRIFAVQVGQHQCWFLPTFDPPFVIKNAFDEKRPLNGKFGHCFRMDIKKGFDIVGGLQSPTILKPEEVRDNIQIFDGSNPSDFDTLLSLLDRAINVPVKSLDIETNRLRPYDSKSKILSCAISFDDINFSFAIDHPKAKWSTDDKKDIKNLLREVVSNDTIKVAHNAPFELEWFAWFFGPEYINHVGWHCTQMQAHVLDERKSKRDDDSGRGSVYQSLDFLMQHHFGLRYKGLFNLNKKDLERADIKELLTYNATDTKFTLMLFERQSQLLIDGGRYHTYMEGKPRQSAVALMQFFGVDVDQQLVVAAQEKLKEELCAVEEEINNVDVVKAFKADTGEFSFTSNGNVLSVFKDYLKRTEVVIEEKGKKRFSVDSKVLDKIDHPLAALILKARNKAKLKSTYVDGLLLTSEKPVIFTDGRLHTNFNTTFSETARLTSDRPNMQNFPSRKDAWVRGQIIAPPGHILLAADFGQLEGCTAAMCSKDEIFVKALWDEYDLHMEWAQKTASLYPAAVINGDMKKFRSLIKNKLVFPAMYGAANKSIAGYLNIPINVIDKLMDEFWSTFHGLKNWQDLTMRGFYDYGYVESPTGRRRYAPLTRNEAINHPIQSVACDIVCRAMNRLSQHAVKSGEWHIQPRLNIHDDLTFVIPNVPEVIDSAIERIYKTMVNPGYSFINVPLSVKLSAGLNWYEMEEIGTFWSNK